MIPKYYDGREYILWKIPGYGFVRQEKKTKIFSETNSGYTWTQFDPKQSQVEVLEGYICRASRQAGQNG